MTEITEEIKAMDRLALESAHTGDMVWSMELKAFHVINKINFNSIQGRYSVYNNRVGHIAKEKPEPKPVVGEMFLCDGGELRYYSIGDKLVNCFQNINSVSVGVSFKGCDRSIIPLDCFFDGNDVIKIERKV